MASGPSLNPPHSAPCCASRITSRTIASSRSGGRSRSSCMATRTRSSSAMQRGVVVKLYLLDPCRVQPLVADDGSIFYQLNSDNLSGPCAASHGAGARDHPRPLQLHLPPAGRRLAAVRLRHGRADRAAHPGQPVRFLRKRQQPGRRADGAGCDQQRDRAAPLRSLEHRVHRRGRRQDRGAGRRAQVRADADVGRRVAAHRAVALDGRGGGLLLPCALLQDRRPAAAVPERRDPEPDLLQRLLAIADRVDGAVPRRRASA